MNTSQHEKDGGKSLKLSLDYWFPGFYILFGCMWVANNNLTNFDVFKEAIYINLTHSKPANDEQEMNGGKLSKLCWDDCAFDI